VEEGLSFKRYVRVVQHTVEQRLVGMGVELVENLAVMIPSQQKTYPVFAFNNTLSAKSDSII
jgi:hypothetical protein